ncbi:hypothetical protein ACJZ2D_009922 [Fusarium nematophilum]
MSDNTPRLPNLHPNVKKARARKAAAAAAAAAAALKQASTPHSQESGAREEIETVLVAVQGRGSWCPGRCPCHCHDARRSNTPAVLSRVLGQLFVGYSGIPFVSRCRAYSTSS